MAYIYVASGLFQGDVQYHPFCLMDKDIGWIILKLSVIE
jgi:hypothetical protein